MAERRTVDAVVEGSTPFSHPIFFEGPALLAGLFFYKTTEHSHMFTGKGFCE
jgi:hypothetical protein